MDHQTRVLGAVKTQAPGPCLFRVPDSVSCADVECGAFDKIRTLSVVCRIHENQGETRPGQK
jgi:hypothetical protein